MELLKGIHWEACWPVAAFLWESKMLIMFCFTQVNTHHVHCDKANFTQVVAQLSSELRNCHSYYALSFCKLFCLLNSPNFSKMTFSITEVSLFQKRIVSNFLFILYSDLYFTYLWDPFDSYYHPVKQTEHFVTERRARKKGKRWCCSKAAI